MDEKTKTIIDRARALLARADWYAYDPENGMEWHGTQADAKADALAALDNFRDASPDGWHEDVGSVQWGVLIPFDHAEEIDRVETPDAEFDYLCDYAMKPHELGDALMTVIDGAATLCDALESAERRAEEAEAQANECRSVVQMVGDYIEEWAANEFIVVDYDDEPMPSIRRVVTGTTAGRALLDRLHAAEAKVARMEARKAAICGCVSCCSGHVAPDIEDACPDCHGSGAVIVDGGE